jgi:hypothetical protein
VIADGGVVSGGDAGVEVGGGIGAGVGTGAGVDEEVQLSNIEANRANSIIATVFFMQSPYSLLNVILYI